MSLSWENSTEPYTFVNHWDAKNHNHISNENYSWHELYNGTRLTMDINDIKLKQIPHETLKLYVDIWKECCSESLLEFMIQLKHDMSKTINMIGHYSYRIKLSFSNYLHEFSPDYIYEVVCKLRKTDQAKTVHLFSCYINRTSQFTSCEVGFLPLEIDSLEGSGRQVYFCIRRHNKAMMKNNPVTFAKEINPEIEMNLAILRKLGCDVVFEVKGGQLVPAHRSILEIHSPVILSMFKTEMLEKKSRKIQILSIEKDVIYKMLDFLYTGRVDELEEFAEPLFDIANYFQMEKLIDYLQEYYLFSINPNNKNIVEIITLAELYNLEKVQECLMNFTKRYEENLVAMPSYCDYIIESINVENAVNRLFLSTKYNLNDVRMRVFDFIKEHYNEMIKNADFLNMFVSHGELMQQIHIYVHHNPDADGIL